MVGDLGLNHFLWHAKYCFAGDMSYPKGVHCSKDRVLNLQQQL